MRFIHNTYGTQSGLFLHNLKREQGWFDGEGSVFFHASKDATFLSSRYVFKYYLLLRWYITFARNISHGDIDFKCCFDYLQWWTNKTSLNVAWNLPKSIYIRKQTRQIFLLAKKEYYLKLSIILSRRQQISAFSGFQNKNIENKFTIFDPKKSLNAGVAEFRFKNNSLPSFLLVSRQCHLGV